MNTIQRTQWLGFALLVLVGILAAACGPAPTPQVIEKVIVVTPTAQAAKVSKVAVIFSGKAQDQSFNQFMYDDVKKLVSVGKVQASFAEDVAVADFERVAADYANQNYDLIIGHTSDYADAGKKVAQLYPNIHFAVTSSISFLPNLAGMNTWTHQSSAVAGYLVALLSKSKKVGIVGAFAFPTQFVAHEGFKFGVFSANRDNLRADRTAAQISCVETFTNSWTDTALGYESAKAQMDQGADYIYITASGAGVGVIQAAQETKRAYVVGAFVDLKPFAPGVVITSVERHATAPLESLLTEIKNGTFVGKDYGFDLISGGTSLTPYKEFDNQIPQNVKDRVEAFRQSIVSGRVLVPFTTAKLGGETGCTAPVPAPTATPKP